MLTLTHYSTKVNDFIQKKSGKGQKTRKYKGFSTIFACVCIPRARYHATGRAKCQEFRPCFYERFIKKWEEKKLEVRSEKKNFQLFWS